MTQIITGERFVGQAAAEAKRDAEFTRKFAGGRPTDVFEDPDHLIQYHADLMAEEQARKDAGASLRSYINFWAGDRRRAIQLHKDMGCYRRCPTCLMCLNCKWVVGLQWRCSCDNGTKQISPFRLVWLNGSIKRRALTRVWSVGEGWVPRETEKYGQNAVGLDVS